MDETRVGGAPQSPGRAQTAKAALVVVHSADKDANGKRYPLGDEDVTLGRDAGNTVVVGSDQASRTHARIFVWAAPTCSSTSTRRTGRS